MPLDSSTYSLAHLRTDGRRWNDLRRLHAQMSTQAAADGSSYLEMGNTKIICTVIGPRQGRSGGGTSGGGQGNRDQATIEVEIGVAGFSGVDRRKRSRTDKRIQEMQYTIAEALKSVIFMQNYPGSTMSVMLHVLAQDGALLAACINATTLALVDAGVPMRDYVAACTTGITEGDDGGEADPLLDLSGNEEVELPFLTVGSSGGEEKVAVLVLETRVLMGRLESMIAVGLDGCKQIRGMLDAVVREHGRRLIKGK